MTGAAGILVVVLGLGLACGAWAALQLWVGRMEPSLRGDGRHAAGACPTRGKPHGSARAPAGAPDRDRLPEQEPGTHPGAGWPAPPDAS